MLKPETITIRRVFG